MLTLLQIMVKDKLENLKEKSSRISRFCKGCRRNHREAEKDGGGEGS